MEENPDNLFTVILFIIIMVIIPLVMLYRRGYFFNIKSRLIHRNCDSSKLPSEWTITSLYKLSWFDKLQIDSIKVILDYYNGHKVRFQIKGGKFIEYPFENSNYLQENILLDKDKILIREWEKKNQDSKCDVIII